MNTSSAQGAVSQNSQQSQKDQLSCDKFTEQQQQEHVMIQKNQQTILPHQPLPNEYLETPAMNLGMSAISNNQDQELQHKSYITDQAQQIVIDPLLQANQQEERGSCEQVEEGDSFESANEKDMNQNSNLMSVEGENLQGKQNSQMVSKNQDEPIIILVQNVRSEHNVHKGSCIGHGIQEFKFMSELEERHRKAMDNRSLGLQVPQTIPTHQDEQIILKFTGASIQNTIRSNKNRQLSNINTKDVLLTLKVPENQTRNKDLMSQLSLSKANKNQGLSKNPSSSSIFEGFGMSQQQINRKPKQIQQIYYKQGSFTTNSQHQGRSPQVNSSSRYQEISAINASPSMISKNQKFSELQQNLSHLLYQEPSNVNLLPKNQMEQYSTILQNASPRNNSSSEIMHSNNYYKTVKGELSLKEDVFLQPNQYTDRYKKEESILMKLHNQVIKVANHARHASKRLFLKKDVEGDNQILQQLLNEDRMGPPVQIEESKQWRASMIGVDKSIRSFLDKIDMKNGDSIIDLSQIVFHDGEKEEAFDLQKRINMAQRGDTIELPSGRIQLDSLIINKPLTIIGKPGTTLEVQQTIQINFESSIQSDQIQVDVLKVEEISKEFEIPNSFSAHLQTSPDAISNRNTASKFQQNQSQTSVKRATKQILSFQEIQFEFNRNRAFSEKYKDHLGAQNLINKSSYSLIQAVGVHREFSIIPNGNFSPLNNPIKENSTGGLAPKVDSGEMIVGCFNIESGSFVEMRDCYVLSIKDPQVIEREKELFIQAQLMKEEEPIYNDVQDYCFSMNLQSIQPLVSQPQIFKTKEQAEEITEKEDSFNGVLSLQSTTIADFHFGILSGFQSVLSLDNSSIINNRGIGVHSVNPRILKIDSCIFQNFHNDAINVNLIPTSKFEVNPQTQSKTFSCKILVASSRFMQVSGSSVCVQQFDSDPRLQPVPDKPLKSLSLMMNSLIKILNNKFYNSNSPSGILSFSNLYLSGGLEVNKNDLIRNSCGNGIILSNVQAVNREPRKNFIKENLIQECQQGHGLQIDRSTCLVENCEIIKCEGNGIHAVMNQIVEGQSQIMLLQIRNTLARENQGSGVCLVDIEGLCDIQDCIFNLNERNGIQMITNSANLLRNSSTSSDNNISVQTKQPPNLIMHRVELKDNKLDGINVKNYFRCYLYCCVIQMNRSGAIFFEGTAADTMIKIAYSSARQLNDIKGKVYGQQGLLYPRVLSHEDIEEHVKELRSRWLNEILAHYKLKDERIDWKSSQLKKIDKKQITQNNSSCCTKGQSRNKSASCLGISCTKTTQRKD